MCNLNNDKLTKKDSTFALGGNYFGHGVVHEWCHAFLWGEVSYVEYHENRISFKIITSFMENPQRRKWQ